MKASVPRRFELCRWSADASGGDDRNAAFFLAMRAKSPPPPPVIWPAISRPLSTSDFPTNGNMMAGDPGQASKAKFPISRIGRALKLWLETNISDESDDDVTYVQFQGVAMRENHAAKIWQKGYFVYPLNDDGEAATQVLRQLAARIFAGLKGLQVRVVQNNSLKVKAMTAAQAATITQLVTEWRSGSVFQSRRILLQSRLAAFVLQSGRIIGVSVHVVEGLQETLCNEAGIGA
ncbi:hypothetical protein QBC39DRAFT_365513 [Podospora conica]|nr:hypothetical protein QBC39DRAFT_365513 [Schizothecium conicum]